MTASGAAGGGLLGLAAAALALGDGSRALLQPVALAASGMLLGAGLAAALTAAALWLWRDGA